MERLRRIVPRKKSVKLLQVYLSIIAAVLSVLLFLIAVTGFDRMFEPHHKCMDGVLYYKFALSMTVAYRPDGKLRTCNGDRP